jgi:hypothetical protein
VKLFSHEFPLEQILALVPDLSNITIQSQVIDTVIINTEINEIVELY